jgi:hypothetical protein
MLEPRKRPTLRNIELEADGVNARGLSSLISWVTGAGAPGVTRQRVTQVGRRNSTKPRLDLDHHAAAALLRIPMREHRHDRSGGNLKSFSIALLATGYMTQQAGTHVQGRSDHLSHRYIPINITIT